ncbi:MAG: rhodanese-like domain-containing protein [Calditrichaeota bacterium]|nr:MAG: rhodanese-like domain-containing protein [Calditrichota bacterium]
MKLPAEFEITCQELKSKIDNGDDFCLVDVREPHEFEISKIENSIKIPLGDLPSKLEEIPKDKEVIIHCRSGVRSANAVMFMSQAGYTNIKNLVGGINYWAQTIDTNLPVY